MSEKILIKGSLLWDATGDELITDPVIVIENGIIKTIRSGFEPWNLAGYQIFSFPFATLIPGLIDSHTHLSMDSTLDNYLDHMSDPVAVLALRASAMMRKDLKAGITTCRCLGDKEFLDIACRNAVEKHEIEGPHLLVATRGIRAPQGHGFVGYPFEGKESIVKAIQENITAGADLIKIYITGTLKGTGDLPSYLSYEEIKEAINTAHEAGLPIASHCVGGTGLDWALELGLDTLEHAYHITPAQIEKLEQSKTCLVLTPGPMLDPQRIEHLPANLIQGHYQEREQIYRCMSNAIASGLPFAVGSDGNHGELAGEIEYLIEMGASPVQALQAATIHAAKASGIDRTRGILQPGKWADILVLGGNPLQNIQSLRQVTAVFKKGVLQNLA